MKANELIHIRPNIRSVEDASTICEKHPAFCTHIVMLSANNYLVIMHLPSHECFVCRQTGQKSTEKYIY